MCVRVPSSPFSDPVLQWACTLPYEPPFSHAHMSPLQILYYDGQFDDSRMNVALACTAAAGGAAVANYMECKELIKVGSSYACPTLQAMSGSNAQMQMFRRIKAADCVQLL